MYMRGFEGSTRQPRINMRGFEGLTRQPRINTRGFTLIELLVVLSIIIVILAIAVPVWSTLSGNNSVATAQNQIASMLGNARADALYNKQMTGVFFFIDPVSGQFAMAEVQADLWGPQAGGGYYASYVPTEITQEQSNPNAAAATAASASALGSGADVVPLEMVNYLGNPLPNAAAATAYVYYRDVVLLPAGVGVALCNNSNPYGSNPLPAGSVAATATAPAQPYNDRYVRFGAIMFDANGALTTIPYAVPASRETPYVVANTINAPNQLGKRIGLVPTYQTGPTGDLASQIPPAAQGTNTVAFLLTSQTGLLIYDHNAYLNQKTSTPKAFTDVDIQYALPGGPPYGTPSLVDKESEESWLDQNGVAFLVSPFDGSLIKAK
jgi:prepilin-type N-terminal cleavage/methylation domain-containing protein